MARRRKQDQAFVILAGIAIILAIPIWIISKTADAIGSAAVFIIAIALIVGFFILRSRARAARRAQLLAKYGDPNIVELIMQHRFWQGQTHYQLIDSLGNPVAVDDHMLKTKKDRSGNTTAQDTTDTNSD